MYCVKCGQLAEDGNTYCANCGAELQKPIVIPEDDDSAQEALPTADGEEKRIKPVFIFAACVVVLASLVLLLLNFSGIKNWFLRTASTPENLLLTAYKQSMNSAFSTVMENYEELLTAGKSTNVAGQAEIVLRPGEQILDALAHTVYADEGDVSWLSDIRLRVDFAKQNKLQEYLFSIGSGEGSIASIELLTDAESDKLFLSVPEMSSQYLLIDIEQDSGMTSPDMDKLYAALPPKEVLAQLAVRYLDIIMGGFSNVEKYSECLTLDAISQDVTVLEAYIDHADLLEVFDAFLKQVKADEQIKTIAEGLNPWYNDLMERSMTAYNEYFDSVYEPVDLYSELITSVDASLSQLQEEFKNVDPENHIYLYTYINDSNEIVGIELVVSGMDKPVSYLALTNTEQYSMRIHFGDLEITGSGNCAETLNGSFTVNADGQKIFGITLEDVTRSKGKVYLVPSPALLDAAASGMGDSDVVLCVSFEENEDNSQCLIDVLFDKESILAVEISGKTLDFAEIILPPNTVDGSEEENVYAWLTGLDMDVLLANLKDAGVPESILNAILQSVTVNG